MLWKKPESQDPKRYNEILSGKCPVCGTIVEVEKYQAIAPSQDRPLVKEVGIWSDLYYTECVTCRDRSPTSASPRVYVMRKRT